MRFEKAEKVFRLTSEKWTGEGEILMDGNFIKTARMELKGRFTRTVVSGPIQIMKPKWSHYARALPETSAFMEEMEK